MATPLAPVVSDSVAVPLVANVPLTPVAGAVNVTITPLTGLLLLSTTVACRAVAKAVETVVLCVPPLVALIPAGVPAVFDKLKLAGVVAPVAEAETLYVPTLVLAVNAFDVATPLALVVSVSVADALANVPFGSAAGAVNVTVTPAAGVPFDVTVAASG